MQFKIVINRSSSCAKNGFPLNAELSAIHAYE